MRSFTLMQKQMTMKAIALLATLASLLGTLPADCHSPDQPAHRIADLGDLRLEDGGVINRFKMSYVTHGHLSATKDNAILVLHGFAANHHAADHLIGPGRAFDTDKYFIICTDELGSTQTTFEHSSSPTSSGLKMAFPIYKARDQVEAEYKLVTKGLGLSHLLAVVGLSSGAEQSLQMAVSHPLFMDAIVAISGGALRTTQDLNFGPLMGSILEACPGWQGGNYDENPQACAANALLMLAPYFYTRDWWEQYIDSPNAYAKWRAAWGASYFDIQDARDLYYRQRAAARGWVGDTPGFDGDLRRILRSIKAKTLFVSNPVDQLVPRQYIEMQAAAIPRAQTAWIESVAGHLICCDADPAASREVNDAIMAFLRGLSSKRQPFR